MDENNSKRWYDKDKCVSEFIQMIQNLDEYSLYLVAKDFLRTILEKYSKNDNINLNDLSIKSVSKYNRWYDWNYDIHTSIEYLKYLSAEERSGLVNDFKNICIKYLSEDNEELQIAEKPSDEV